MKRSDHPFSQVAVDQSIEQTINRDTKIKVEIIGKSLKKGNSYNTLLPNIKFLKQDMSVIYYIY